MEKVIKLDSRYSDVENTLEQLKRKDGEESKTYILKTTSEYIRVSQNEDKIVNFIDLEGGPILAVGKKVAEADAVIDSINYSDGFGYTVTFR